MLRREALESIGGFLTECLVEDIQSSMEMMAKGWRTAYLGEKLQFGLVPDTYHVHLKQFVRWVRTRMPISSIPLFQHSSNISISGPAIANLALHLASTNFWMSQCLCPFSSIAYENVRDLY